MNCLDCKWLRYYKKYRDRVYCAAGMLLTYNDKDRVIKWSNNEGIPLDRDRQRQSMRILQGCKVFESVKGD